MSAVGDGVANPALAGDAPAPLQGSGGSSTRGASSSPDAAAPEPNGSSDGDGGLSRKADTSEKHTGILDEAWRKEPCFVKLPIDCAHEKEQTRVVDLERQITWEWVADPAKAFDLMSMLWKDMAKLDEWILAVDVEYRYDNVCVVQLATRQRTFVLDAGKHFGGGMLMFLKFLLEHKDIHKIFHGEEHHISALKTSFEIMVQGPTYDTAKRAYICDGERENGLYRSLPKLCQVYLGYELPSVPDSMEGWAQRPLPEEMIRRAAMEAHVLFLLKDRIEERTRGRPDWEYLLLGEADH